jgi:hypothetical protein
MKIAVIGGGSTYTPELVNGFLERLGTLPVTELWKSWAGSPGGWCRLKVSRSRWC